MKAQELMLGSLVQLADDYYDVPKGTMFKVVEIYADTIFAQDIEGAYEGMELPEYKLEPIPLTPEILKKNGFDFLYRSVPGGTPQEQRMRKVDTYKWRGLAVNYYHETNDFQMVNFRGVRLDYVHQLQHALRLCGIEKEIVL